MVSLIQESYHFPNIGRWLSECIKRVKMYVILFFLGILAFPGIVSAQFSCPDPARCTSKDLEVVDAFIEGVDNCFTCTAGTTVTKNLIVKIANKTGSERTSFAVFANL